MKKMHTMAMMSVLAACAGAAQAQQAGTFDKWIRTWSDEFPGTAIDTTKWNVSNYAPNKNNEQEYYRPLAVTVGSGEAVITSTFQPWGGRPYTSGEITTRGKFTQQYGRFEARAKLPRTRGLWPAFWMLPASDAWPPEIDIMELLGHDPTRVHMTHHWGTWPNVQSYTSNWVGPDFTTSYHEFRVDWYPDALVWYVDGVQRSSHNAAIPQEPFYMILNTAVGGDWPGMPDATTVFPQRYHIEYVRAYKCLINSSFDQLGPTGNVQAWQWTKSGNVYAETLIPRTGTRSLKLFGPFTGTPNSSTAHQDFPAVAGERFRGSAWFLNRSTDPMAGANVASIDIEFRSSTGTVLSTVTTVGLTAASPRNVYNKVVVDGQAPAGTATARFMLKFYQPAAAAGAAFIDDAEFGYFAPCFADFNADGTADFFDYLDFVAAFSTNAPGADFNADTSIDFFDYLDFVAAFSVGC